MASTDSDDFRIQPGRSRSTRACVNPRDLPFTRQVELAILKAGGNLNRIGRASRSAGGGKGRGNGRFKACCRGAKVLASFPWDSRGWQRDSMGRFRSCRVLTQGIGDDERAKKSGIGKGGYDLVSRFSLPARHCVGVPGVGLIDQLSRSAPRDRSHSTPAMLEHCNHPRAELLLERDQGRRWAEREGLMKAFLLP